MYCNFNSSVVCFIQLQSIVKRNNKMTENLEKAKARNGKACIRKTEGLEGKQNSFFLFICELTPPFLFATLVNTLLFQQLQRLAFLLFVPSSNHYFSCFTEIEAEEQIRLQWHNQIDEFITFKILL